MAQIVLRNVSDDAELQPGTLFRGLRFWLSQKVPQRSRFINDVRANGGEILPIEKTADVKIVDHARKEALPGTHSYTFIENSIRNGKLEDLQDHKFGPSEGTTRSVGSMIQPAKATRNKYTQEDDRILWNWVNENPQKGGGTDGNEIYKQLEVQHPQHPWQSWRDRWIKQLKGKPRPFPLPHNAPPTPPSDVPHVAKASAASKPPGKPQLKSDTVNASAALFEDEDTKALMKHGTEILEVPPENMGEAWKSWAREYDTENAHSAQEWQEFWEKHVRPQFLEQSKKQARPFVTEKKRLNTSEPLTPLKRPRATSNPPSSSPLNSSDAGRNRSLRSPSYHPESPSMQLLDTSSYRSKPLGEERLHHISGLTKNVASSPSGNGRRNDATIEEELPSSSPPETVTPQRGTRPNRSVSRREIPSTPDRVPIRMKKDSPFFIESEDCVKEEESDLESDFIADESQMGKEPSDTLSEPEHVPIDTQKMLQDVTQQIDLDVPSPDEGRDDKDLFLREPTQAIDLEVPSPDGGWDDGDPVEESLSETESTPTELSDPRPTRQGTQAILRGQTAAPDFEIPEPEGGWEHVIPSSPPPVPSSPPSESETSDVEEQIDAWINTHATEGITVDRALWALKSTSLNTELAELVLKSVRKEGKIPEDKRGVWTDMDDEDLSSTDARKIQRLESKHGKECLTARWEFLSAYGSA